VTGSLTLSGGLNETRDGEVQFLGGGGASCEDQARTFTGLSYYYRPAPDARLELNLVAYLPKGQRGPGKYDLTGVGVDYRSSTDSKDLQMWDSASRSGQATAVLVLRPDASGTMTVAGLQPVYPNVPARSQPLNATLAFTCG
jgi:hypothetical protein